MPDQARGLAKAREIYKNRSTRALELKAEGKKVVGYICLYPVVEMLTAADIVPFRLFGDMREPITLADAHMASVVCPFMRSVLDTGMKGRYDFLDGVVFAHVCDVACMIPGMWRQAIPMPYSFFLDVPHTTRPAAQEYFRGILDDYRTSLEAFTGTKITTSRLNAAVAAHNRQRALVRDLYELRKPDPPLVSGAETLQVLKSVMSLPVEEANTLLVDVISEVKARSPRQARKKARLLIWGSIVDDTALIDMIESLDAAVVMDDMCVGSRAFFGDVPVTLDPLDGLAKHYLADIKCPRTFREAPARDNRKDYSADLESRFGYLKEYAREWNVNGVVLQSVKYCDGHGYEVPAVKDFCEEAGLPSIYLEHTYSEAALAPLRTRVQALTEIIG